MHRSKQIIIASILTALWASLTLIRASIAIATQNQEIQEMGNSFVVIFLILCTVSLVSVYGVWQNQKWGKVLTIITLGVSALLSLPGVIFAPTLLLKLDPALTVIVAIAVITLLLYRPKQPVTV